MGKISLDLQTVVIYRTRSSLDCSQYMALVLRGATPHIARIREMLVGMNMKDACNSWKTLQAQLKSELGLEFVEVDGHINLYGTQADNMPDDLTAAREWGEQHHTLLEIHDDMN